MIQNLKSYKIIQGIRNQEGVNEKIFAEIIEKISALILAAPEIAELDLNPLLGNSKRNFAVDARIRNLVQQKNNLKLGSFTTWLLNDVVHTHCNGFNIQWN